MTGVVRLTEADARALTEEVKADAAALWAKVLRLYEDGVHLALGYSSWSDFCAAEFGHSDATAYRLLQSARVMEQLPMGSSPRPSSERVARELVPILRDDPGKVEEVWAEVVAEHGPQPTAAQVRDVVDRIRREAEAPAEPEPEPESNVHHLPAWPWDRTSSPAAGGDEREDEAEHEVVDAELVVTTRRDEYLATGRRLIGDPDSPAPPPRTRILDKTIASIHATAESPQMIAEDPLGDLPKVVAEMDAVERETIEKTIRKSISALRKLRSIIRDAEVSS